MMNFLEKFNRKLYSIPDKPYKLGFLILIGISMLQFLLFRYAPSLDGPQHLHNAYVLKDLLFGKGMVREFYNLNSIPVGYWTTPVLLSFFTTFSPPWLAETLFLVCYVIGISLAFRYFIKSLQLEYNPIAQYLIFPFIPSFFLLAGYYAFSFGIAVFLLVYGYWNRRSANFSWSTSWRFSLLLLLLYFTHGLVFVFFLATFILHYLFHSTIDVLEAKSRKETWQQIGQKTLRTVVAFLPVLIVLFIYSRAVISIQSTVDTQRVYARELLEQLFRIRPIIGFHHEMESVATKPLFLVLVLIGVSIIVQYLVKLQLQKITFRQILLDRSNIYLFTALIFLVVYMANPDQWIAGSMTVRVGFFFFLFLIMWIPFKRIPLPINILMGLVILFAVAYNQALMPYFYKPQVQLIKEIQEVDPYVEEGASMITLRESDNWLHLHYGLYAGLDLHLINLNNPQCYGPFPLVWDPENSSAMYTGEDQVNVPGLGRVDPATHPSRQVDYILVFYHDRFLKKEGNETWRTMLEEEYEMLHLTSGKAAAIYQRK